MSRIEFIHSKLSNCSAHVSVVTDVVPVLPSRADAGLRLICMSGRWTRAGLTFPSCCSRVAVLTSSRPAPSQPVTSVVEQARPGHSLSQRLHLAAGGVYLQSPEGFVGIPLQSSVGGGRGNAHTTPKAKELFQSWGTETIVMYFYPIKFPATS